MKPLFGDSPTTTATAVPAGFQQINLQPQVAQPIVPYVAQTTALVTVSDADIDKLGETNAARAAETSKKILANVRASDTEGFGKKLNELVATSKKLDPNKMQGGFISKFLGFGGSVKERLMGEFASVQTQMDRLTTELDGMATLMKKRVDDCDTLFEENYQTFKRLEADVATGQQMIAQLEAQIAASGQATDAFGAQAISDLNDKVVRARKRVDDFQRGMTLATLAAPEIRLQQKHCRSLANTVRDIKVTTIPAWQGVFSRYILALETKKGAELVNTVYDATDAAFRMQADQLRTNTQEIAKAQERSVVSIETLEHMQTQLLGAVDDALRIAKEGREARDAAKPKLAALEQGLIQRFSPSNLLTSN